MRHFYDVDLRHARLREFAFGTPWYLMPLVGLFKFLGFRFPGSTDDPPVESLAPFETDAAALPEAVRARFQPLVEELIGLGFHSPIYHVIENPLHATRIYWATFLHPSGRAWARIHCRIWTGERKARVHLFPMFFTALNDGSFFVSSGGKPDMLMPESVRMVNEIGATPSELWESHCRGLEELWPRQPLRIGNVVGLREAIEKHHVCLRDYNLARGVFKPLSDAEQPLAEPVHPDDVEPIAPEDVAVLAELERLQTSRPNWWMSLLVLGVSLLLFVGAFRMGPAQPMMWVLIPVVLFHELGHYAAMRWFGYRNLRMFFIPFFGAAVSGRHYNVAGWKKAVVALMGPVPGIVVGGALGLAGLRFQQPQLTGAALLMLILNGFNLLPLLPLDGGWIVHAVLFVRHPVLDVVFRFLAILALLGIGVWSNDKFLIGLPLLMLLGLPMAWRIARTARRLRQQGVVAVSRDAQSIPPEAALPILDEVRTALPGQKAPRLLAQTVANVFQTLNARPPGVVATLALLAVHVGSLCAAVALAAFFAFGQLGGFWRKPDLLERRPAHAYEAGTSQVWRGPKAPAVPTEAHVAIIATFDSQADAKAVFEALPAELPRQATLRWFGDSVILTLPADREEERTFWTERLRQQAGQVVVDRRHFVPVRLFCVAPSAAEAEALETELRHYLQVPNGHLLLPPWSAAWEALPAGERARFEQARRTMGRLEALPAEARRHPDVQAIQTRLRAKMRTGDEAASAELSKALAEAVRAEEQRLLASMRAEGDASVDQPLVALWSQLWNQGLANHAEDDEPAPAGKEAGPKPADPRAPPAETAQMRRYHRLMQGMAERMGRLPLAGNQPAPGSDREAGHGGTVSRQGLHVAVEYVMFPHPGDGLPALAEWLGRRGCSEIRYDFEAASEEGEDAEDAP